jgi:hypothetical protein
MISQLASGKVKNLCRNRRTGYEKQGTVLCHENQIPARTQNPKRKWPDWAQWLAAEIWGEGTEKIRTDTKISTRERKNRSERQCSVPGNKVLGRIYCGAKLPVAGPRTEYNNGRNILAGLGMPGGGGN